MTKNHYIETGALVLGLLALDACAAPPVQSSSPIRPGSTPTTLFKETGTIFLNDFTFRLNSELSEAMGKIAGSPLLASELTRRFPYLENPLSILRKQTSLWNHGEVEVHISTHPSVDGLSLFAKLNGHPLIYVDPLDPKTGAEGFWVALPEDSTVETFDNGDFSIFNAGENLYVPVFRLNNGTKTAIDWKTGILNLNTNIDNDHNIAVIQYQMAIMEPVMQKIRQRVLVDRVLPQNSIYYSLAQNGGIRAVWREFDLTSQQTREYPLNSAGVWADK